MPKTKSTSVLPFIIGTLFSQWLTHNATFSFICVVCRRRSLLLLRVVGLPFKIVNPLVTLGKRDCLLKQRAHNFHLDDRSERERDRERETAKRKWNFGRDRPFILHFCFFKDNNLWVDIYVFLKIIKKNLRKEYILDGNKSFSPL